MFGVRNEKPRNERGSSIDLAERGGSDRCRPKSLTFLARRKPGGVLEVCPAIVLIFNQEMGVQG